MTHPPPVRVGTDDSVYRVKAVWLGPAGWSMPWQARYLAYAVFFAVFPTLWGLTFLVFHEVIPVWALCLSILATKAVMQIVDHDVTIRALLATARCEARSWRRHKPDPVRYTNTKVTIR